MTRWSSMLCHSCSVKVFLDLATRNRWVLLAAAWLAALSLRGISIAISPVLPLMKADLALSYAETGFLFAVPTLFMAAFGIPGGFLADSIGMKRTIALGLTMLVAGSALRAVPGGFLPLVIWTALLGAGMGVANPGLTRMVKDRFPDLPGTATGIFTSGFIVGATMASWLTFPYMVNVSGSWRGTFLVWSGYGFLALLVWLFLAPEQKSRGMKHQHLSGIWRDKTVWKLNIIFLMMNLAFYSMASWIPTYYHELGMDLESSTRILTIFIITGLPSGLLIPLISDRFGERKWWVIYSSGGFLPFFMIMMFFPMSAPVTLSTMMGIALAGTFALCFALPLDYVEPSRVGSVAGFNILVGYALTFLGPMALGGVHDLTGSFKAGWFVVIIFKLCLIGVAWSLPKQKYS